MVSGYFMRIYSLIDRDLAYNTKRWGFMGNVVLINEKYT